MIENTLLLVFIMTTKEKGKIYLQCELLCV